MPPAKTWVWISTIKADTCTGCGAAIVWATNARTERPMPFDSPLQVFDAMRAESGIGGKAQVALLSHFATCPKADAFRK